MVWCGQLERLTKGDLALSQIVQVLLLHGVGKMKTKGSKLFNQWKGKEWVAHFHTGTMVGTTGLNKGFEKSGLKVNKKGAAHAEHGYHS